MIISGIGRLGREPKMQYTPAGTAVTNLSVAFDAGYGEKRETIWLSLVAFAQSAELLNQYLSKGSRLVFSAEITKLNTYTKKDGTTGVNLDAKILTFNFVDKAEGEKDAGDLEPEDF